MLAVLLLAIGACSRMASALGVCRDNSNLREDEDIVSSDSSYIARDRQIIRLPSPSSVPRDGKESFRCRHGLAALMDVSITHHMDSELPRNQNPGLLSIPEAFESHSL